MKPAPLTLRVMRLYKPKMRSEQHGFAGQPSDSAFALTPGLMLPESFGTIHLGQTFSSYVTVYNHSAAAVRDVVLSSELITATKRVVLSDERAAHSGKDKAKGRAQAATTPAAVTLQPGQNACMVVRYQLNEKDVHTLNVLVSYVDHITGETTSFRKYFRFKVVEPLQVGLKRVDVAVEGRSESFVQATFKNTSPSTLAMQSVTFKPAANFAVEALSAPGTATAVLKTNDMHQYLFRVSPAAATADGAAAAAAKTEEIGSVDIMWRGPMGEFGHLQTPALKRDAAPVTDVQIEVTLDDGAVALEELVEVTCTVRNSSSAALRLEVHARFAADAAVAVHGYTRHDCGELAPGHSAECVVHLVPLRRGLHQLRGFVARDAASGREFACKPVWLSV